MWLRNSFKLKRLTNALQAQCNLSNYEARSVIRSYRTGKKHGFPNQYTCEAVAHYGGSQVCLKDAIKKRHLNNKWRKLNAKIDRLR